MTEQTTGRVVDGRESRTLFCCCALALRRRLDSVSSDQSAVRKSRLSEQQPAEKGGTQAAVLSRALSVTRTAQRTWPREASGLWRRPTPTWACSRVNPRSARKPEESRTGVLRAAGAASACFRSRGRCEAVAKAYTDLGKGQPRRPDRRGTELRIHRSGAVGPGPAR